MTAPDEIIRTWAQRPGRHIVNLSGGKDSTALAIFLRGKLPQVEYLFCDTHKELPETYEYLDRLAAYLQRPIIKLNAQRGFDHWLDMYGGMLPSARVRWCTRKLKIEPFEAYVGDDTVWSYVGIRADEARSGYVSTKPNIHPVFPFKEFGLTIADVERLLEASGLGLPAYYEWRQRSGCYFVFSKGQASGSASRSATRSYLSSPRPTRRSTATSTSTGASARAWPSWSSP